jgi:hypothetical protein
MTSRFAPYYVRRVWWTLWRRFAVYAMQGSCAAPSGELFTRWERVTKTYKSVRIARRRCSWIYKLENAESLGLRPRNNWVMVEG